MYTTLPSLEIPGFKEKFITMLSNPIVVSAAKSAPPVIVSGLTLFDVPISDIAVVCTIIYTLVLTAVQLRKLIFNKD